MASEHIGNQRWDALERGWTLLWQAFVGYALTFVISLVALVWTTVDLLWSLFTNRDDLESEATPAVWINATLSWSVGQTVYGLTGGADGCWKAIPRRDMAQARAT